MKIVCIVLSTLISFALLGQNGVVSYADFDKSDKVALIAVFQAQPNLSLAKSIKDKVSKGRYVHAECERVADISQSQVVNYLNAYRIPYQKFSLVNAIKVDADRATYSYLKSRKEIRIILSDQSRRTLDYEIQRYDAAPRARAVTWGITNIEADSLWKLGYWGQGVVIGGQDTGYEWYLPQIRHRYRGTIDSLTANHNYNWHDAIHSKSPLNANANNPCGFDSKVPCDDDDHGTHTMGTMVGSDTAEYIGVAPMAKWIGCRNMDRGWGAPSTYLECFQWFLAPTDTLNLNPDPSKAPDVINNSWGCPASELCNDSTDIIMRQAIINLKLAGVVVVVSAGNSGPSCNTVNNPAGKFEESFSVGAYASTNVIANFSSRGSATVEGNTFVKPDVSAPGVAVRSIIKNGSFASYSGTSMAGPHVAGAVAVLLSAMPSLKGRVADIERILEMSAIPTNATAVCNGVPVNAVPNNTYGHGRINLVRALSIARSVLALGNNEVSNDEIVLAPNPAFDKIVLSGVLFEDDAMKEYSIYDINGKRIHAVEQNSNLVELPLDIRDGVCLLQVKIKTTVASKRFIVQGR